MDAVLPEAPPNSLPSGPAEDTGVLAASVRRWMTEAGADTHLRLAPEPPTAKQADNPPLSDPSSRQLVPAAAQATVHERPEKSDPSTRHRVAVLIAADGFDAGKVPELLATITQRFGRPATTRVYADWTAAADGIGAWSQAIQGHGVQPIHTMSPGQGATSVALSLDALDAVHHHGITCLVVVGAPDGMQPLITRLRAGGTHVVAAGPASGTDELTHLSDDFIPLDTNVSPEGPGASAAARQPGRHRRDAPLPSA